MKKGFKWLLGILIGLIVVGVLAVGAILAINWWNHGGILAGNQTNRFRSYGQVMPWQNLPQREAPQYRMPMMRPYVEGPLARLGIYSPFRLIFLCLICVGFILLIVLGIVYLVSPKKPATAVPSAPQSQVVESTSSVPAQPSAQQTTTCPHCSRAVQADWSHCPYCGAPLTDSIQPTD